MPCHPAALPNFCSSTLETKSQISLSKWFMVASVLFNVMQAVLILHYSTELTVSHVHRSYRTVLVVSQHQNAVHVYQTSPSVLIIVAVHVLIGFILTRSLKVANLALSIVLPVTLMATVSAAT